MSKLIAIKEGNKTRYVTKEIYDKLVAQQKDRSTSVGDITCSGATSVGMGFTDEQWDRIHGKKDKKSDKNA